MHGPSKVVVGLSGGRYVTTCAEMKISGFGPTEKDALASFKKKLSATIKVKAVANSDSAEAEEFDEEIFLRFSASPPLG